MFWTAGSATLAIVSTSSTTTAMPYEHLERASAGLCAELRQCLLHADVDESPSWNTVSVTVPPMFSALRGRTWYQYPATGESRRPFGAPSGHVRTEP